jgi:hypothetical protein
MGAQMTLLQSFLGYKKVKKEAWLAEELEKLELEFETDMASLNLECDEMVMERQDEIERMKKKLDLAKYEVSEMQRIVDDKKETLEKKNHELAQQMRLLEAKASPDQVWLSAFQLGFSKAWGMMKPVMYEGFDKVKQEISDSAKMETLNGLQSVLRGKNGTYSEEN